MIYRIVWTLFRIVFTVLLRWRVRGQENVPATGPVLVAANHVSYLDPPVVGVGMWRPGTFMAKEDLFKNRFFGWFIRSLNAFPVRRGSADRAALKRCLDTLADGRVLVIFPEGTRSETGELQEPEMGVGMIAYRSGAPVVPVYLWGTDRVMPRRGGLHLARIGVTYGKPLRFVAAEGQKPGREEYESAAREIMAAIRHLKDDGAQA